MASLLRMTAAAAALTTIALAGCADGSGSMLPTASVDAAPAQAAEVREARAPRVSPACVNLAMQIDTLRKEGSIERLEKAAAGSGATVPVKRASLSKQVEYNKLNAEFQAKCGPPIPMQAAAPQQAAATAAKAAGAAQTPLKAAVTAKAAQAPSGVTILQPSAVQAAQAAKAAAQPKQ
jgi:outer membrane murein-binding lipoprotein Lpp